MTSSDLPLSTLTLFVLFGTNWVVYSCLWMHERSKRQLLMGRGRNLILNGDEGSELSGKSGSSHKAKKISQPLAMTLPSVVELSGSLAHMGVLITIAWACENRPLYPHGQKVHDMDMFWCLALCLAVASFLNVRKSKGGDILNREQTEEWKGWMQFLFLMYHYFSAHEVYNSIRVMITSYVWLTGFGNFSFFYMKSDFSLIRCLQMLWRLNFLVLLLCMVMNNTYILYYICPLHTFYFFVVYMTMRVFPELNHSKSGIRYKLMAVGFLIYCVWDLPLGLFRYMFFFLSDTPKLGAGSGTMWEWYFRSSLDHWSTFLGMIFALNFPMSTLWLKRVEEKLPYGRQIAVKLLVSVLCIAAVCWWAANILPEAKLEYNQSNAYYGCLIPMLSYIFLRNLTPMLRTTYLEPLHSIGKITLETYLFQHHVWLTSNAKTVLTLIPGMPKINLVVAGVMYVVISKQANTLTLYMRGILMPDDLRHTLKNMAGITAAFMVSFGLAYMLKEMEADWAGLIATCLGTGFISLSVLHTCLLRKSKEAPSLPATSPTSNNNNNNNINNGASGAKDDEEMELVPMNNNDSQPMRDRKPVHDGEAEDGIDGGGGGGSGGSGVGGGGGGTSGAIRGVAAHKKQPSGNINTSISNAAGGAGGGAPSSPRGEDKGHYDGQLLKGSHIYPAFLLGLLGIFVSLNGHAVVHDYLVTPVNVKHIVEDREQGESCLRTVNHGMWKTDYFQCSGEPRAPWYNLNPYCNKQKWTWIDVPDQCHLSVLDMSETIKLYKDKTVVILGDSVERHIYYAVLRSLGQDTPQAWDTSQAKHSDFSWTSEDGKTVIKFLWAAMISDLNTRAGEVLSPSYGPVDMVVLGGGLWDALHTRDAVQYAQGLAEVVKTIQASSHGPFSRTKITWVKITAVVESRLKDEDKVTYLTKDRVLPFKEAVAKSNVLDIVDAFIDGYAVTAQRADQCDDGVHYSFEVYDTFSQLLANIIKIFGTDRRDGGEAMPTHPRTADAAGGGGAGAAAAPAPKNPAQHSLGSMGNPIMGAVVLAVAAVMIFSMDAYHGLARLSLYLFTGVTLTWEDAYSPLLAKLGRIRPPPHPFPRVHS